MSLALAIVSVETVAWLFASSLIVVAVMQLPEKLRLKFVSGLVCVTLLFCPMARDAAVIEIIGAAYFTLRHVHVLLDWSNGQLETPPYGNI